MCTHPMARTHYMGKQKASPDLKEALDNEKECVSFSCNLQNLQWLGEGMKRKRIDLFTDTAAIFKFHCFK